MQEKAARKRLMTKLHIPIDQELKDWLIDYAFQERMSVTAVVRELILELHKRESQGAKHA